MLRYVWFVAKLSGLLFLIPSTAAKPSAEGTQQVQSESKNDNLLLSEISQTIQEWSNRCVHLDKADRDGASECWRHAAAATDRFLIIGEPFAQQLRQLQAAWLTRSAQIRDRDKSHLHQEKPSRFTPQLAKAPTKSRLDSTKKVASTTKSVKKSKLAKTLRRKRQTVKTIEVKNLKAVPVAVRHSTEEYSARKAELRAIRDRLKRIERKLGCTSLKCESNSKDG